MKMNHDSANEDNTIYKVVMNHEEQYSIWPEYKAMPSGWTYAGKTGPKAECLAHIKEVWTDMRPLSLRKKMEELERNPPPPSPGLASNAPKGETLVERLCKGEHAVEAGLHPEKTVNLLKEVIERGYVYIKFTETKGGTELGFHLDPKSSDIGKADFEKEQGIVHLEGDLVLDSVKVRCIADIDLSTLQGRGRLIKLATNAVSAA